MRTKQRIDAHQHFWIFDPLRDSWMDESSMSSIRRDFLPSHLKSLLDEERITHTIAVQADQSDAETKFLLQLAEEHDFIAGVVGWIDLKGPNLPDRLERLAHPKLLGYRHVLQGEERGYIADPLFIKGVQQVGQAGLTYDILVYAHQLSEVITLVDHCAGQPLIIDHLAKPDIKSGKIKSWEKEMRTLGSYPTLYCKVSGMVTEAHWELWSYDDLLPYLEVVFDAFGPTRCVFGSDWPVCTLAGTYAQVVDCVRRFVDENGYDEDAIFSENARRFYQLRI